MKNRKKIIIVILILICIVTSLSIHKNYEGIEVEEIEEKVSNNKLVFWVQQDNGNYTESLSSSFPVGDYLLNTDKTKCEDLNGGSTKPTITYQNGMVTVSGKNTAYCEIYFDKCKGPVGTVLASKDKVSKCEVGGMYRYQGTDNVNNWICFGTVNQTVCKNNADKYMYRIIGVTEDGELKLLMNDFLRDTNGDYDAPAWGYMDSSCTSSPNKCQWNNSYLFNDLNGLDSNIDKFKGNSYYSYLNNSTWSNLINASHKWKYGDITDKSKITYNGYEVYDIENAFSDTVQAPIGTIYIHDYLFAYPGGNPGNAKTAVTSWMADSIAEQYYAYWTMTRMSGGSVASAYKINWGGDISTDSWDPGTYVRPVFYLIPGVTFKSGTTGEKTNPYIIDGIEEEVYTATFHYGSKKNDTITTTGAAWSASWTLPNATEYCLTTQSTSANCSWTSFPPNVTNSYSSGNTFPGNGTYTYYFYVRNADGQMASDSDTVIVSVELPTCSFNVTTSGVTLVPSNAESWYLSTSPTSSPSYGTGSTTSALGNHTYYGYVTKTGGLTGTCQLEMYQAKVNYCTTSGSHTEDKQCTCTTTIVSCECDLGTPRFTYRTGEIGLSQCPATLSGSLPSITCENDFLRPCGEWVYNCTCNDCYGGTTTYTCSDNSTCTESGCCEKKSCGVETCQSGYKTYTIDKDSIVYCYKNIS